MSNAASKNTKRDRSMTDLPYEVRVTVIEHKSPGSGADHPVLIKDVQWFEKLPEAIDFAQKVWRKFRAD
jgi:hypothetical protein